MNAVAFWILLAVFAARLFFVFKRSASSAFLAATGIGLIGLFCTGTVFPELSLDSLIGGHNFLHLARNLCVTSAVWLIRDGLLDAFANGRLRSKAQRLRVWLELACLSAAIALPFLCQNFVPTTEKYIPENVWQLPVYVYGSVYMGIMFLMTMSSCRMSLGCKEAGPLRVSSRMVALGMGLMALASFDELFYMSVGFAHTGQSALSGWLYVFFSPAFFCGVLVVSLGLGVPPLVKAWRQLELDDRATFVFLTLALSKRYWNLRMPAWIRGILQSPFSGNPSGGLYEFVIRSNDQAIVSSTAKAPWLVARVLSSLQARFDAGLDSLDDELK